MVAALSVNLFGSALAGSAWADSVRFQDDFSGDLSGWQPLSGTWQIQSGQLRGDYDITCGSPGCIQGDLLLADQHQPTTADWKMEVDFTYVAHSCCNYFMATAQFLLYSSAGAKEQYMVGYGNFGWNGDPRSDASWVGESGMPWQDRTDGSGVAAVSWAPRGANHATFTKVGANYSLYLNGVLMHTWVSTTLSGTPKLGLHVYGTVLLDNFKLTELGGGTQPTAAFTWSPTSPTVGQAVQFTDTSTGSPTSWSWDFGDGSTFAGQAPPPHTYTVPGPQGGGAAAGEAIERGGEGGSGKKAAPSRE